jgi:hypothetical protein
VETPGADLYPDIHDQEGLVPALQAKAGTGRPDRAFRVGIQGPGFSWAAGVTDDLDALVDALDTWRRGMPVDEFASTFPFVPPGEQAKIHEADDPVAAQWQWLLTSQVYAEERPLVKAAHADRRLRALFPALNHGTIRLNQAGGRQGAREVWHPSPTVAPGSLTPTVTSRWSSSPSLRR